MFAAVVDPMGWDGRPSASTDITRLSEASPRLRSGMDEIGRIQAIVVDCLDPTALSGFWAAILGSQATVVHDGWVNVGAAGGLSVAFQRVPEAKVAKNRLHLDLQVDDIASATLRCVAAGATPLGSVVDDALGDEMRVTVVAAGFDRFDGTTVRRTTTPRGRERETDSGLFQPRKNPFGSADDDFGDDDFDVPSFLK